MPHIPKERDCGWFYYSPSEPTGMVAPENLPPPSQIDCLTSIERDPLEQPRLMFRNTDSKYVRLAKMGGRQDLLQFKENSINSGPAKCYPRSDWYYLEDNLLEDKMQAAKKHQEPYQFGQPDYMMHQPVALENGNHNASCQPRSPWAVNKKQDVFESPVKIAEKVKPGFGIRSQHAVKRASFPEIDKEMSLIRKKNVAKHTTETDDEKADMGKLMSNGYEKEWQDRISRLQDKRVKAQETLSNAKIDPTQKLTTEYKQTYGARRSNNTSATSRRSHISDKEEETTQKCTSAATEPFKLSKFKNVPSRIDSHQSTACPQKEESPVKVENATPAIDVA